MLEDHVAQTDSTLIATAVLLLVSDGPAGGTAVVIATPNAPTFVVLGDDTEEGFARLRAGAIAYGMPETYRALPRDMVRDDERVLVVRNHRYRHILLDRTGSLFGATAEKVLAPVWVDERPFDRLRIPIPSLERPAYVEYSFAGDAEDGLQYRLTGEAVLGEGYICVYCGKLCEHPEPHTAAHGVAGHPRAGILAGEEEDAVHGYPPEQAEPTGGGARQ
jgi:hypothetical protein